MSTRYYALQEPITSLRVKDIGGHKEISIWINRALSGRLTVRNEELPSVLSNVFSSEEEMFHSNSGWGYYAHQYFDDNAQLISEYGELFTVAEIKEKYYD